MRPTSALKAFPGVACNQQWAPVPGWRGFVRVDPYLRISAPPPRRALSSLRFRQSHLAEFDTASDARWFGGGSIEQDVVGPVVLGRIRVGCAPEERTVAPAAMVTSTAATFDRPSSATSAPVRTSRPAGQRGLRRLGAAPSARSVARVARGGRMARATEPVNAAGRVSRLNRVLPATLRMLIQRRGDA